MAPVTCPWTQWVRMCGHIEATWWPHRAVCLCWPVPWASKSLFSLFHIGYATDCSYVDMGNVSGLHDSPTCLPSPFMAAGHLRTAAPTRRPRQFGRSEGAHLGTHHTALHRRTPFTYVLLRPWGAHRHLTRTRNGRAGAGGEGGMQSPVWGIGCGAAWHAARSARIGAGNRRQSRLRTDQRPS